MFFNLLGLALVCTTLLLVVSRDARRVTLVGGVFGPALGMWIVAPHALERHYLAPETAGQWALVVAFFTVVFHAWSLVLTALASWPIVGYRWVQKRAPVSPVLALLWVAITTPLGYVALAAGIEISVFSRLVSSQQLQQFSYMATPLAVAGAVAYLLVSRRVAAVSLSRVLALLLAVWVGGVAALVARSPEGNRGDDRPTIPRLERRSMTPSTTPLLVVGLDGASWQLIQPLIDKGRVPTFARLAATVKGTMHAQWPPYWSSPAWGSILTGYGIDELGVHEDLSATVEGLPLFELPLTLDLTLNPVYLVELALVRADVIEPSLAPRRALQRPPAWERLSSVGVKTAVIRFPFTYPASNQADLIVSNLVVADLWAEMGVEPGRREELVSPTSRTDALLSWFSDAFVVDETALHGILPTPRWPKPADAVMDPTDVVRTTFLNGQRTFSLAEYVIKSDPDLDVVMLYVVDLDNISHALWAYRFPEEFPKERPAQADVDALGPVADRYVEYLDDQLSRLIRAFPAAPNVLVISDHGQEAAGATMSLWKGAHSARGVFMAAGPDIAPQNHPDLSVSYLDVIPTILDLLRFEQPRDLTGRSVVSQHAPAHAPSQ
jgi:predicted AlkP superfamily phosphohydrolase/phosphomutase